MDSNAWVEGCQTYSVVFKCFQWSLDGLTITRPAAIAIQVWQLNSFRQWWTFATIWHAHPHEILNSIEWFGLQPYCSNARGPVVVKNPLLDGAVPTNASVEVEDNDIISLLEAFIDQMWSFPEFFLITMRVDSCRLQAVRCPRLSWKNLKGQ